MEENVHVFLLFFLWPLRLATSRASARWISIAGAEFVVYIVFLSPWLRPFAFLATLFFYFFLFHLGYQKPTPFQMLIVVQSNVGTLSHSPI